ncbi:MAG: hypothetical protein IH934_02080 [Nanoarchaeota archaeon]|nr:hypothetical protein [Nanoarchaeota archaeon]
MLFRGKRGQWQFLLKAGSLAKGLKSGAGRALNAARGIKESAGEVGERLRQQRQKRQQDKLDLEIWRREQQERQQQQSPQQGPQQPGQSRFGGIRSGVAAGVGLMGGLAVGGIKKTSGATIFIILAFLLFLFDVIVDYKGFNITSVESFFELGRVILSLGYVIGVWVFFIWFVSRDRSFQAMISWVFVLIIIILSLGISVKLNPLAVIHIIFILIFWMSFIRQREENVVRANTFLVLLLVADLYAYSLFNILSPKMAEFFVGFPFLFILVVVYIFEQTNNIFALILMIGVVAWYFLLGAPQFAEKLDIAGIEGIKTRIPSLSELPGLIGEKLISNPIERLTEAGSAWLSGQIQYAVTGKVEQNQFEPLGVYLDNVESVASRYYIDEYRDEDTGETIDKYEEVIIYGTVRGRTLDDPINLRVGCFVERDGKKEHAELEDPRDKFTIFAFEEQDFACTFTEDQLKGGKVLKEGSNTITTFADFNFETLAFQKVYFMDRERLRAMTREGLDVFDEFGIKDKRPVPVYTNGPVAIEMGTTSPLVGVSENYLAFPRFSLAIKNREGWQGRITGLKELVLLLPKGVRIENPGIKIKKYTTMIEGLDGEAIEEVTFIEEETKEKDCNVRFRPYGIEDCQNSCEIFVLNECNDVCKGYGAGTSDEQTCRIECTAGQEDCKDECQFLFDDRDQEYKGYALAQTAIDKLQKRVYDEEDATRFERFNCKLNPIRNQVLGNTPITTKFFRVKVRYDYTVEEAITVQIVKAPEIGDIEEVKKEKVGPGVPSFTESNVVTLYEHEKRGGDKIGFGIGEVPQISKLNDEISSIDVKPGYVITYYEDKDYKKACRTDIDYVPNLKDVGVVVYRRSLPDDLTINDEISSLNVSKFEGAVLYEDENFKGRSDYYGSDANNFDNKCLDDSGVVADNKVTSIIVAPGYQAILYKDDNFNDLSDPVYETDCSDDKVRCIPETIKEEVTKIGDLGELSELKGSNREGFDRDTSSIRIVGKTKDSILQATCEGRDIILATRLPTATEESALSVCQKRCTALYPGKVAEVREIEVQPYEGVQILSDGLCEGNAWAEDFIVTVNSKADKNTIEKIGWNCFCKKDLSDEFEGI